MWVVLQEVTDRLQTYWRLERKSQEEKLTMGITSPIPLPDLYSEIDAHFLRRKKQADLEAQLLQRAVQFRAVQRRLLTKYKDKTPTPLTNLDNLLDGTYKQILQLTEIINQNMRALEESGCQLSCVVRLLLELMCLQSGMDQEQKELLSAALSPIVYPNMDQGWEELVDCSVTFVLRTIMGKGGRDMGSYTQNLSIPSDTNKLKKHISLLVDKILKGGVDLNNLKPKTNTKKEPPSVEEKKVDTQDPLKSALEKSTDVPLGSKLGVDRARSARIRSARLTSARPKPQPALRNEDSVDSESSGGYGDSEVELNDEEHQQDATEMNLNESLEDGKSLDKIPSSPIYEEIEEPIYSEIEDEESALKDQKDDESMKKLLTAKENVIEAPEDIFGNPLDEDDAW